MLQQIGLAKVSQASEVLQAMAEFELIVPDLVFCAVQMRPLDGLQFLRSLRQLSDPHLAATPIVLFASEVEHGAAPQRLDYHVSGYLAKPVSTVQLHHRIDAVIAANPLPAHRPTGLAPARTAPPAA